jgi:TonB family protein
MFLLSKLDEVSRLFPDDVEGTREFLLDRGIPAGSLEALTHFSARLAIDPSFQRDVTSLVQVVIRREDEEVDYMDLLGILVVAAAGPGPFNANDEQEESVREILRFLTQIRRPTGAVGPVFVRSQNVVPPVVAAEPLTGERASLPVRAGHDVAARPVSSVPFARLEESKPSRWRGAAVWIAGGMALAVALGSGWMLYQKSRSTPQTTATLRIVPSSSLPVNEKDELAVAPARRVRKPQATSIRKPSPAVARHLNGSRAPLAESPMTEHAPPVRSLRPPDAGRSFPPVNLTPPAKPDVIAESNTVTRPLNAAPESAAKSTPPVNTSTASTPSIRRRLPKSVVINPGPLRRLGGSSENLDASAAGVVHPASIGMMASNLISSPAPAYPAAASQARVQGEVTVRAVVDREGNVTDARVVSGPELLRDVSLEAVQHWRYRPYMQGGKPVEVATTAVLDFELP